MALEAMVVDPKVKNFFDSVSSAGVRYAVWKNVQNIPSFFDGGGELDIYVPSHFASQFRSICTKFDWVEVSNPVAVYPWVHHYYLVSLGKTYHLHLYHRLVTGESWLKEYLLPEIKISDSVVTSGYRGVVRLSNSEQCRIFAIRHLLKGCSLSSRLLYKFELEAYSSEWSLCCDDFHLENSPFGNLTLDQFQSKTGLYRKSLQLPNWIFAAGFRLKMSPFLRYSGITLPSRRFRAFVTRLLNKVLLKRKKLFGGGGMVIAVSGVDGAGKSTMLSELRKHYSQFLTTESLHLGRPYGKFINLVRSQSGQFSSKISPSNTTIGRSFKPMIIALLRLRLARKAIRLSSSSRLVLVDRWPTNELGKMDGPRLSPDSASNWICRLCQRIESWAYENMPRADVCIFVKVPQRVALERNLTRVKVEKESQEEIIRRHEDNSYVKPIADEILYFDNAGEFSVNRIKLIDLVWEIVARQ